MAMLHRQRAPRPNNPFAEGGSGVRMSYADPRYRAVPGSPRHGGGRGRNTVCSPFGCLILVLTVAYLSYSSVYSPSSSLSIDELSRVHQKDSASKAAPAVKQEGGSHLTNLGKTAEAAQLPVVGGESVPSQDHHDEPAGKPAGADAPAIVGDKEMAKPVDAAPKLLVPGLGEKGTDPIVDHPSGDESGDAKGNQVPVESGKGANEPGRDAGIVRAADIGGKEPLVTVVGNDKKAAEKAEGLIKGSGDEDDDDELTIGAAPGEDPDHVKPATGADAPKPSDNSAKDGVVATSPDGTAKTEPAKPSANSAKDGVVATPPEGTAKTEPAKPSDNSAKDGVVATPPEGTAKTESAVTAADSKPGEEPSTVAKDAANPSVKDTSPDKMTTVKSVDGSPSETVGAPEGVAEAKNTNGGGSPKAPDQVSMSVNGGEPVVAEAAELEGKTEKDKQVTAGSGDSKPQVASEADAGKTGDAMKATNNGEATDATAKVADGDIPAGDGETGAGISEGKDNKGQSAMGEIDTAKKNEILGKVTKELGDAKMPAEESIEAKQSGNGAKVGLVKIEEGLISTDAVNKPGADPEGNGGLESTDAAVTETKAKGTKSADVVREPSADELNIGVIESEAAAKGSVKDSAGKDKPTNGGSGDSTTEGAGSAEDGSSGAAGKQNGAESAAGKGDKSKKDKDAVDSKVKGTDGVEKDTVPHEKKAGDDSKGARVDAPGKGGGDAMPVNELGEKIKVSSAKSVDGKDGSGEGTNKKAEGVAAMDAVKEESASTTTKNDAAVDGTAGNDGKGTKGGASPGAEAAGGAAGKASKDNVSSAGNKPVEKIVSTPDEPAAKDQSMSKESPGKDTTPKDTDTTEGTGAAKGEKDKRIDESVTSDAKTAPKDGEQSKAKSDAGHGGAHGDETKDGGADKTALRGSKEAGGEKGAGGSGADDAKSVADDKKPKQTDDKSSLRGSTGEETPKAIVLDT